MRGSPGTSRPGRGRRALACLAGVVAVAATIGGMAPSAHAAGPSALPAGACNYYYEWLGVTRFPLQPDPHATYTYVMPSNQAAEDDVGFLVRGQFIHGVWTSWMTYTGKAQPFDVANFVNNPPANTNNPIVADEGSVNPFEPGTPMNGTPRNFTLLWTPSGFDKSEIADTLDGTTTADIDPLNQKNYPSPGDDNQGASFWALANRNYNAFPGYNPGGTTQDTFPVTTAVNLKTGEPVDCQKYNVLPDAIQRSPLDPPAELNRTRLSERIILKNGQRFFSIGGLGTVIGNDDGVQYAPPNPGDVVQWTRPQILPGADVSTIPPPQNCAGYLGTRTDPRRVTLIRIPRVANFTSNNVLMGDTTSVYPNPFNAAQPWQAAYTSLNMYGTSLNEYISGSPNTGSIAGSEYKIDASGGSTIMVWPRNLNRFQQEALFNYAKRQGWAIMRGGTQGIASSANMLYRVKGSASDFQGRLSNVPCFFGTTQNPTNTDKTWVDVPTAKGSQYAAAPYNLGPYAPSSVACERNIGSYTTIVETVTGQCERKLAGWIAQTGGSYYNPAPPSS